MTTPVHRWLTACTAVGYPKDSRGNLPPRPPPPTCGSAWLPRPSPVPTSLMRTVQQGPEDVVHVHPAKQRRRLRRVLALQILQAGRDHCSQPRQRQHDQAARCLAVPVIRSTPCHYACNTPRLAHHYALQAHVDGTRGTPADRLRRTPAPPDPCKGRAPAAYQGEQRGFCSWPSSARAKGEHTHAVGRWAEAVAGAAQTHVPFDDCQDGGEVPSS